MTNNKAFDSYSYTAVSEDDLVSEVTAMEENSEWRPDIESKELRLEAIESPMVAMDCSNRYGLDYDLMQDTEENTKLLLDYWGEKMMVRDTAISTIGSTAGLYGNALGRMGVPLRAETLNNGLSVARGSSLILMRHGKVSAVHSGAEGGYQIMPITALLDTSINALSNSFGDIEFREGFNSHGFTSALWALPDSQGEILDIYADAISGISNRNFGITMMPAVRFVTSDTANACACLTPVFLYKGLEYRFVDGLSVKHSKRFTLGGKSGLEAFELGSKDIFAQFKACAEVISKLANTTVYNGCNCVISLCKRYNIPKKYGEAARLYAERFTQGGRSISAHDLYLCMAECVAEAKRLGAGYLQVANLQEAVAKIVNADWAAHDVGGTVAW